MTDLLTPPTEIEIAEIIASMNRAGLTQQSLVVRQLALQCDYLKSNNRQLREAVTEVVDAMVSADTLASLDIREYRWKEMLRKAVEAAKESESP